MKRIILENVRIALVGIIFSLGVGVAFAWTGPTTPPPSSTGSVNVPAPINLGSASQIKQGGLWLNSLGIDNGLTVSGVVGIGVTAPVEKLEVSGNVKATAFLYSSDFNLKKDIKPLGSELDKVLSLRPVSFNWKSDDSSDVGFIAQEVEKIFPEVVHTNKTTNLKSIDYPKLTVFLVQALQEQQKQIEQLKLNR